MQQCQRHGGVQRNLQPLPIGFASLHLHTLRPGCWAASSPQKLCAVGVVPASRPRRPMRQRRVAVQVLESAELCYLQDCQSLLSFPMTLPIIPFTPNEALAPGCTKVLHLYEDKDLELLDAVMAGSVSQTVSDSCDDIRDESSASERQGSGDTCGSSGRDHEWDIHVQQSGASGGTDGARSRARVFVHSTIEMGSCSVACASSSPGALVQGEFVFFLSTLVQVLDVRSAAHGGVDVTIRGEGRVSIARLKQLNPYITGEVWPVLDVVPCEVLQAEHQQDTRPWPEQATQRAAGGCSAEQQPIQTSFPQQELPAPGAAGGAAGGTASDGMLGKSEVAGATFHGAEMGWTLRAMVQELREVAGDVQGLLLKLGREESSAQLSAALEWADDANPLMCNLGSGSAAFELYCTSNGTAAVMVGHGSNSHAKHAAPAPAGAVPLPCAVSQLDRATRLSFALLSLAQGAGGEGWAGGATSADPRRAAFCTLDTRERLQMVITAAKSARARLAAQAALRRVRRY